MDVIKNVKKWIKSNFKEITNWINEFNKENDGRHSNQTKSH